jgi:hypothetical protein
MAIGDSKPAKDIPALVPGVDFGAADKPQPPIKDHKFDFQYEQKSTASMLMSRWASRPLHSIGSALPEEIIGGIGMGTIYSGAFKGAALSFGILAAKSLVENYQNYTHSASSVVGELALGAGAAIHAVANFLPSHLVLTKTTRVEGPDRPPTPFNDE